ncbi:oxygenase MpaB family protein [Janibacter sp. G1551]|uniref:oxygenase MpaB family protein n=1 Tax=Janibacter sp. G1551 TaxID=3420440 RepID=UPI003D053B04
MEPVTCAVAAARLGLGTALRDRVSGESASQRAAEIWGADGERWFTSDDVIWQVHGDAAMFIGGIRALLLQSLHPLAMAGVAGHSGYKSDPWGRLERTSHFIAMTTMGPIGAAEATIEKVRAIHRRVRGRAPDGRPYRADDPDLLRWVHVAEAHSFVTTYQAFGPRRLTDAELDIYCDQAAHAGELLGATEVPHTWGELVEMLDGYRPVLMATPAAKEAARFVLLEPPLPLSQRPGYAMLAAGAVATLPVWAREMLDLPRFPGFDGLIGRPLGRFGTSVSRWAITAPELAETRQVRPSVAR